MGSIMAFLLLTCGLLLLLPESVVGVPCIFPFTYNGKTYSTCTKDDYDELWCATLLHHDSTKMDRWKPCNPKEYGGNDDGRACVFPFVYKGETFYTCTNLFKTEGDFWCATTGNYDQDGKWSLCPDTGVQPGGSYKYP